MSRVAKNPVTIPTGITVTVTGQTLTIKNNKLSLSQEIPSVVQIVHEENVLRFVPQNESPRNIALAGTARALVKNIVVGIHQGYQKKLELVGIGYRAQIQGKKLTLSVGYSHPVIFDVPEEITIEVPSQTEVIIKGVNKHLVGEVAAKIRSYRPPECYKGKGIRYAGEKIVLKETKKK